MNNEQEIIELGIVGIKNMGDYNSETAYEKLNVVTYNGSSYCAKTDVQGILPTNTTYWQLYAEKGNKGDKGDKGSKGDTGDTPVKGVDYFTQTDIAELESSIKGDVTEEVSGQLGELTAITPVAVSSASDMTDTSKIYVLTTDGYWYWYNGSQWTQGGVYQATGIADDSVSTIKITQELRDKLNIAKVQNMPLDFVRGAFYNNNGVVADGDTVQNRIKARNVKVEPYDTIEFTNTNNLYKIAYAITDSQGNAIIYKGFSEYSSSSNKIVIESGYYFNIQIAKADNANITDEEIPVLAGLVNFSRYRINTVNGITIQEKTIDISQIKGIKNTSNNLFDGEFGTYSYGTGYQELRNNNASARGLLFRVEPNESYNIKVFDTHDRFRLIALYDYPKFTGGVLPVKDAGKQITVDDSLNEYTFINTDLFKCFILVVSSTSQEPRIMISKSSINNYEAYGVAIKGLNENQETNFYTIPDLLSREVYFTETEYTETCEMQGCCTDGTYLYFGMHDALDTDNGVLGKIRLSDGVLVDEVKDHPYGHVNGMCYYDNKLYIASTSDSTGTPSTIYIVDASDLSYIDSLSLEDTLKTPWENLSYGIFRGVGAIAYSNELSKFVCLIRRNSEGKRFRGFAILDNNFNLEKIIKINPDDTPETCQITVGGLDADDKYIYLTMAKDIPGNYKDAIHIYDYNGNLIKEKLLSQNPRDYIEGIAKLEDVLYTSNASDKICKYTIDSYENIPLSDILTGYNPN